MRIEINHVPATVELELRAAGWIERRHVIEDVTRHGVWRDHVRIAVGDKKAERRIVGQQCAQIVLGAGLQATTALPVPMDVAREQCVGHLCLETQLIAGIGGHGATVGAGDNVENRIGRTR